MDANDPGQPPLAQTQADNATWSHNLSVPTSALAIGAHPDDVEFGAGGTLAKWAAAGCVVHHLVLTDGSKGTWNVDADLAELIAQRQREQREAAAVLTGGTSGSVTFLGQIDGELDSTLALRGEVARVIRSTRPEVVLAHDPWKRYRLHPDHRHAGLLACDGVVAARDPHFFKEHFIEHGLPHHRPAALLLWEADDADHVEEVSNAVDIKLAALHAHTSQFESTMKAVDDDALGAFDVRIRARLRDLGAPFGYAAAEVFKIITNL